MDWKNLASKYEDFTEFRQAELRKTMSQCSKDFEFPLAKPYDTEHENFKHFALCLRTNVAASPALNSSDGIR